MKTILLPFHDADEAEIAAETASLLARRFGSYVEALFIPQSLDEFLRGTSSQAITDRPELVTERTREWQAITDQTRQRFEKILGRRGIPFDAATGSSNVPSAGWHEASGREADVVSAYGRLFELIVLGRTTNTWQATCEAALFESGRPVLMAPRDAPKTLGDKVVIAWNRSTETARTIGLGMPLLTGATSIVVLEVEGWTFPGPPGKALAHHLVRGGLPAIARTAAPKGRSNGQTILDEAAAIGADLLFKGAYTQTRLRQIIFGGATRHVMVEATLPVLMAH